MFERFLSELLVKRFGRFIDGLDETNLKLACWQGEVLLEGLELKRGALDDLDLPIRVLWGHIGRFHLKVPWTSLGSQPVQVTIDDCFIVAAPIDKWQWGEDETQRRARANKARRLERVEALRHKQGEGDGEAGSSDEQGGGGWFGRRTERLMTKIVDNLQVTIANFHVRYEDTNSNPERIFAVGLTARELSVRTTDAHGRPCFMDRSDERAKTAALDDLVHKVAQAECFCVYWDSCSDPVDGDAGVMRAGISASTSRRQCAPHEYIVHPFTPTVHLVISSSTNPTAGLPRYRARTNCEGCGITVTREQLEDAARLKHAFANLERWERFYQYRPRQSALIDPRGWWRYAMECVRIRKGRLGWRALVTKVLQRKSYVALRKRRIADEKCEWIEPLTPEASRTLELLEDTLMFEDIVVFRSLAIQELVMERENAVLQTGKRRGQRSDERTRRAREDDGVMRALESIELTDDERKMLYGAVGYDDAVAGASLPRDFVFWDVTFNLHSAALMLVGAGGHKLVRAVFDGTYLVKTRKRSWTMDVALAAFEVFDDRPDAPCPERITLMTRKGAAEGAAEEDMLVVGAYRLVKSAEVHVEFNPKMLDAPSDAELAEMSPVAASEASARAEELWVSARVYPHEVVYSHSCLRQVSSMLSIPCVHDMRSSALEGIQNWKKQQQMKVLSALASRRAIHLSVEMDAPIVVIPEDEAGIDSPVTIVDFGHFSFENCESCENCEDDATAEPEPYDSWVLNLRDMQVAVCGRGVDWRQVVGGSRASEPREKWWQRVIEPFSVNVALATCVLSHSQTLAKMKLQARLPSLAIELGSRAFRQLVRTHRQVRAPYQPHCQNAPLSPRDDDHCYLGGFEAETGDETAAPTRELMEVAMEVGTVSVLLSTDENGGSAPHTDEGGLVELTLQGTSGSVSQSPDRLRACAIIHSLEVRDVYQHAGPEFQWLMSSKVSRPHSEVAVVENLMKVDYVKDKSRSETALTFDALHVEWNPETIAALSRFFCLPATNQRTREGGGDDGDAAVAVAVEEATSAAGSGDDDSRTQLLTMNLRSLSACLNKENRGLKLARVEMVDTRIRIESKRQQLRVVEGRLGNLTVTDLKTEKTHYRELLGQQRSSAGESQSMLEFCLRSSSLPSGVDTFSSMQGRQPYRSILVAELSPMRFVYFQQVWLELIDFVFQGVLGDAIMRSERHSTGGTPAQRRRLQQHTDTLPTTFIKFDVRLNAPLVLVPEHAQSRVALVAVTETITASNSFSWECPPPQCTFTAPAPNGDEGGGTALATQGGVPPPLWVKRFHIDCESLMIATCESESTSDELRQVPILRDPVKLFLTVIGAHDANVSIYPKFVVDGDISEVNIALFRHQYLLIMRVLSFNITADEDEPTASSKAFASENTAVTYEYELDAEPATYDVMVRMPRASLCILDTGNAHAPGEADDGDAQAAIAIFEMRGFVWKLQKSSPHVDAPSRMLIVAQMMTLSDLRPGTGRKIAPRHFCQLFKSLDEEDDDDENEKGGDRRPQLWLQSVSQPTGVVAYTIEIADAAIFVIEDLASDVASYFRRSDAEKRCSVDAVKIAPRCSHDQAAPEQSDSWSLAVRLFAPHVVLLRNPALCRTPSAVVRCNVGFNYAFEPSDQTADIRVSDLQVFLFGEKDAVDLAASPSPPPGMASVCRPLSVSFAYRRSHSNAEDGGIHRELACRLGKCRLLLTTTALKIATEVLLARKTAVAVDSSDEVNVPADREQLPPPSLPDSSSEAAETAAESEHARKHEEFCFGWNCKGLEITVVDDTASHFASPKQSLVTVHINGLRGQRLANRHGLHYLATLGGLVVRDHLQPPDSPLATLLTSQVCNAADVASAEAATEERLIERWDSELEPLPLRRMVCSYSPEGRLAGWVTVRGGCGCGDPAGDTDGSEEVITLDWRVQSPLQAADEPDASESRLTMSCSRLHMEWNPGTILALQQFWRKLPNTNTTKTNSTGAGTSPDKETTTETPQGSVGIGHDPPRVVAQTNILLRSLSVNLNKERSERQRHLVQFVMSSTRLATTAQSDDDFVVNAELGDLVATDLSTPRTRYPQILGMRRTDEWDDADLSSSLVSFRYHKLGSYRGRDGLAFDKTIKLHLSSYRAVYTQQLWLETIDFAFEGILGEAIWGTTAAVQNFAATALAQKTSMDITIEKPVVVLPRTPASEETLVATLEHIKVVNSFRLERVDARPATVSCSKNDELDDMWFNEFKVEVSGVYLETSSDYFERSCDALLLDSVLLRLDLTQPLDGEEAARVANDRGDDCKDLRRRVDASMSGIALTFTRQQYHLLLRVLNDNIWADASYSMALQAGESNATHRGQMVPLATNSSPVTTNWCVPVIKGGDAIVFGFEDTEAPPSPYAVQFRFSGLSVEFRRENTARVLANFTIGLLELSLKREISGATVLDLSLFTLNVAASLGRADLATEPSSMLPLQKEEKDDLRQIMTAQSGDLTQSSSAHGSCPPLTIWYSSGPTSDPVLKVVFNDLTVYVVYGALRNISDFIATDDATRTSGPAHADFSADVEGGDAEVKVEKARCLRAKVVLHHPRVVFLESSKDTAVVALADSCDTGADGTGPSSKALVITGLCVISATRESGTTLGQNALFVNAQLEQVETYIQNAGVVVQGDTGSGSGASALQNPVSLALDVNSIGGEAPRCSCILNIEPLSSQCAFSDMKVLMKVIEGWTTDAQGNAGIGVSDGYSSTSSSSEDEEDEEDEEDDDWGVHDGFEGARSYETETDRYTTSFDTQMLGITLVSICGCAVVKRVNDPARKLPRPGAVVVSINGDSVSRCRYQTILRLLQTATRPVAITFDHSILDRKREAAAGEEAGVIAANGVVSRPPLGEALLEMEMEAKPPTQFKFEVAFAKISFSLINDWDGRDMPLARAQLTAGNIVFDYGTAVSRQWLPEPSELSERSNPISQLSIRCRACVDGYNATIPAWEPLLEPTVISAGLETMVGASTETRTVFAKVAGDSEFNVNIVDSILADYLRVIKEWSSTDEPGQQQAAAAAGPIAAAHRVGKERFSPFSLHNCTGMPVVFWKQRSGRTEIVGDGTTVLPGEDAPFWFKCARGQVLSEENTAPLCVSVDVTVFDDDAAGVAGVVRLTNLPANARVGRYFCEAQVSVNGEIAEDFPPMQLVWEVSLLNGRRSLSLRSPLQISNNSGMDLEVSIVAGLLSLSSDGRGASIHPSTDTFTVISGDQFSPPLNGVLGDVCLRPAGTLYEMSAPVLHYQRQQMPTVRPWVPCKAPAGVDDDDAAVPNAFLYLNGHSSMPTGVIFGLSMEAAVCHDSTHRQLFDITVYPCLRLRNLLPVQVRYRVVKLSAPNREILAMGTLKAGALVGVPQAHLLKNNGGSLPQISLQIDGYHWSEFVDVCPPRKGTVTNTIGLAQQTVVQPGGAAAVEGASPLRSTDAELQHVQLECAASVAEGEPNCVVATLFVNYWMKNMTDVPITYGTIVPQKHDGNQPNSCAVRRPPLQHAFAVTEEVFEVRVQRPATNRSRARISTHWCKEGFTPTFPKDGFPLPCGTGGDEVGWEWTGGLDWEIDMSGRVNAEGWESADATRPDAFGVLRVFDAQKRVHRRRWFRERSRRLASSSPPPSSSEIEPDCCMFQPPACRGGDDGGAASQASFQTGDGAWSVPVKLLSGAGGVLRLVGTRWPKMPLDNQNWQGQSSDVPLFSVAISISDAPPPYHRTRVVTIRSHYVIVNQSLVPLAVCQLDCPERGVTIASGESLSFHWTNARCAQRLAITCPGDDHEWSGGISLNELGIFPVRIPGCDSSAARNTIVRVEVGAGYENMGIQVLLDMESATRPTYALLNDSSRDVYYCQAGQAGSVLKLAPGHHRPFGWDSPCVNVTDTGDNFGSAPLKLWVSLEPPHAVSRRRLGLTGRGEVKRRRDSFVGSGAAQLITLDTGRIGSTVSLGASSPVTAMLRADGPSKMVHFYDAGAIFEASPLKRRMSLRKKKNRRRIFKKSPGKHKRPGPGGVVRRSERELGAETDRVVGGGIFTSCKFLDLQLSLPGLRVSVVDDKPRELFLVSLGRIVVRFTAIPDGVRVGTVIDAARIDNYIAHVHHPILLRAEGQPAAPLFTFALQTVAHPTVYHFQTIEIKLGEFAISADTSTLTHIQGYLERLRTAFRTDSSPSPRTGGAAGRLTKSVPFHVQSVWPLPSVAYGTEGGGRDLLRVPDARKKRKGTHLYFELLHIHPLTINLSFIRSSGSPDDVYVGLRVRMFTDAMSRVQDARLRVDAFTLEHPPIMTPSGLTFRMREHMKRQFQGQLLSLVGSLDALGNPLRIVRTLHKDAEAMIGGIRCGMAEVRPDLVIEGVASGAGNLVRHAVGGVANGASTITKLTSDNIAKLSMDTDYARRRAKKDERRRGGDNKPSNLFDGIHSGGKSLLKGVGDGIFGVVKAPVAGAQKGGVGGFVAGIGKGVLGLVVKPVVGLGDAATEVLSGVSSASDSISELAQQQHLRPQRAFYGIERRLRSYTMADAQAVALLQQCFGHEQEPYRDHIDRGGGSGCILFTEKNCIFVRESGEVAAAIPLSIIVCCEEVAQEEVVILHLVGGRQQRVSMRGCSSTAFMDKVEAAMKVS